MSPNSRARVYSAQSPAGNQPRHAPANGVRIGRPEKSRLLWISDLAGVNLGLPTPFCSSRSGKVSRQNPKTLSGEADAKCDSLTESRSTQRWFLSVPLCLRVKLCSILPVFFSIGCTHVKDTTSRLSPIFSGQISGLVAGKVGRAVP